MKLSNSSAPRALALALLLAACNSDSPTATAPSAPQAPADAPTAPPEPAPPPAPNTLPASTTSPALVLTPPAGWIVEQPTSNMRKAQYVLPHAEGDSEDASLIVYYFGGQGGTREANLGRWASQFEQPDGSSSADAMKSSTRTVAGLSVFDVELAGTYVAETAPGSGVRVNKPDWRMRASIVDTREGPWYFKLVGPAATIAKWEAGYDEFVKALRPGN